MCQTYKHYYTKTINHVNRKPTKSRKQYDFSVKNAEIAIRET